MLDEFIMVLLMLIISFLPTDSQIFLTMLVLRICFTSKCFPSMMVVYILITCLLDNVRILQREIVCKTFLEVHSVVEMSSALLCFFVVILDRQRIKL